MSLAERPQGSVWLKLTKWSSLLYGIVMPESSSETLFTTRLREARDTRGWSQAELAQRADMQPSAIAHFEAARRKPSFDNVRRLAKALGVSTDYLMGVKTAVAFRNEDLLSEADRAHVQSLIDRLAGQAKTT